MEKLTDIINPIKTRGDFRQAIGSGQQQSEEGQRRRERLAETWAAIAEAYGSSFTSQFGEEPNQTWADGLAGYEDEEILKAVGNIINSGGQYAPNLPAVLHHLNKKSAPNQHLMYRSCHEALNAPIIDKGEGRNRIAAPVVPGKTPEDWFAEMRAGL